MYTPVINRLVNSSAAYFQSFANTAASFLSWALDRCSSSCSSFLTAGSSGSTCWAAYRSVLATFRSSRACSKFLSAELAAPCRRRALPLRGSFSSTSLHDFKAAVSGGGTAVPLLDFYLAGGKVVAGGDCQLVGHLRLLGAEAHQAAEIEVGPVVVCHSFLHLPYKLTVEGLPFLKNSLPSFFSFSAVASLAAGEGPVFSAW